MSAVVDKTLLTPEDLLSLPDQKGFELVDGELLERNVSVESSWIGGNLVYLLTAFVRNRQLGWVFEADKGCQCFADSPRTVRRADVSFVKAARMTWADVTDGWLRIVPDLVVEVISPKDLAEELEEKIEMFYKVGLPLIWVVSPTARTVRIVRADGSSAILRDGDTLSGEDVIPGFACPVASIFPPMPAPPTAEVAPVA